MVELAHAETETSAIVQYAYADFANGNIDAVRALIADDARILNNAPRDAVTPFGGEWVGPDGFDQFLAALFSAFDHQNYTVKSVLEHGAWAVVLLHVETIHRESGALVCSDFVDVVRTRDGKIVEVHEHIDVDEIHAAIRAARGAANEGR